MKYRMAVTVALLVSCFATSGRAQQMPSAKVRPEHPRLILRNADWAGPSVPRIRKWLDRAEYKDNLDRLAPKGFTGALRYLLLDDQAAGQACVEHLKSLKAPTANPKDSPSYTGLEVTREACIYDWLRNHPEMQSPDARKGAIEYFEWWGNYFTRSTSPGVVPFYSRNSGALAGLTACGLALAGDSDKADAFLAHAQKYLIENMGTIRQAEDGATGGATYGMVHQFVDLANVAAMWRSATEWDAAEWIKKNQGNWLERQMLFQIYATYPNGWFWKEGDVWSNNHSDRYEHATHVLAISQMYKNGYGRQLVADIHKRYKMNLAYYKDIVAWFYIYNDPDVPARPLSELPLCEVFSPDLHAYVAWRSSWDADGTVIHFKAGENVDHHGTWDTGKFTIFKGTPLAIKNGSYQGGYLGGYHTFYKLPYSANVVIFDHPKTNGWQPHMPDLDGYTSWSTWKARRDKTVKFPPTGLLLAHRADKSAAYAKADLSGSTYPTQSKWIRELCFLDYKYLIVLDRVSPGEGATTKWLLQSINPAQLDADRKLATVTNGKGTLLCQTLLPEQAKFAETGLIPVNVKDKDGKETTEMRAYSYPWSPYGKQERNVRSFPKTWFNDKPERMVGHGRLEISPADPSKPTLYVNVLYPQYDSAEAMPPCKVTRDAKGITVQVGSSSYTFAGE